MNMHYSVLKTKKKAISQCQFISSLLLCWRWNRRWSPGNDQHHVLWIVITSEILAWGINLKLVTNSGFKLLSIYRLSQKFQWFPSEYTKRPHLPNWHLMLSTIRYKPTFSMFQLLFSFINLHFLWKNLLTVTLKHYMDLGSTMPFTCMFLLGCPIPCLSTYLNSILPLEAPKDSYHLWFLPSYSRPGWSSSLLIT